MIEPILKPTPKPRKAPSRLRSKPHVIPAAVREAVLERDGYRCQWCFMGGGRLDLHHILARSQGGKDRPDHLKAVHRLCHSAIHNSPSEARRRGLIVGVGSNQ